MERHHIVGIEPVSTVKLHFKNIRKDSKRCFHFKVSVGDKVSILYIDNIHQVGRGKEYVIEGYVKDIVCNRDELHNRILYRSLILDTSTDYDSKETEVYFYNILDIHKYPYKYDLNENIVTVPRPGGKGYFIREISWPQEFDMSVPNESAFGDYDFVVEGGDEYE